MSITLDTMKSYLEECLRLPHIQDKFRGLLGNLSNCLQVKADIAGRLGDHPIVRVHCDFAPTNILSDDDSHLTGIVDWESSTFLPLGWDL